MDSSSNSVAAIAVDALKARITKILPAQIRACVEQLDEEQLWWRPNKLTNSVGNLVLHVSGSIRHYVAREVGGMEYARDRAGEFAEQGPLAKEQLLSTLDEAIEQVSAALDSFDHARLLEPTSEPAYYPTILDLLVGVTTHVSTHAGQIVYVTKMLKEGALDEVWIRTHRS